MTTGIKDGPPAVQNETDCHHELQLELERLLDFKKEHVRDKDLTPCPACAIPVRFDADRCPHCESNIAAHNALVRESLRRLDEITFEIDREHDRISDTPQDEPRPSLGRRLKNFFSGPQAADTPDSPEPPQPDRALWAVEYPRTLDNIWEGEPLKVLECHGPWLRVKTRDGRKGWVYSTIVRDR